MIKLIIYLHADHCRDMKFDSPEDRNRKIMEHPNARTYTIPEFAEEFNMRMVDPNGYLVVKDFEPLVQDNDEQS